MKETVRISVAVHYMDYACTRAHQEVLKLMHLFKHYTELKSTTEVTTLFSIGNLLSSGKYQSSSHTI
jgi:hypothetical protein